MSRRKIPQKKAAPTGNETNLTFVKERFEIFKKDIQLYKAQQAELKEEELKLLKFIDLESKQKVKEDEDDDEEETDQTQRKEALLRRVNQIKQQVELINKVSTQVEKNLHLNEEENKKSGLSQEQIKQLQLKEIQEEQTKYQNLVFNMDYQFDMNQNRAQNVTRDDYNIQKWFQLQPHEQRNQIRIYSYSYTSFYVWIQNFTGKNDYQHLYLSIQRLETEADFFKFDDFIQTIKLANNSFQSVSIDVSFDNNLCILALLRFLVSLNKFNNLSITPTYTRNQINASNVSEILQSIFEVIFSHRHLQGLKLQMPFECFDSLVESFGRINSSLSQLRVLTFNSDLKNADTNKVQDYFKFVSTLPHLYHFAQNSIPVSAKDSIENLNAILKRVRSTCLNIVCIPSAFTFEFYFINMRYIKLDIGLEPNILTNQKLENLLLSLKEAKNLSNLKLAFFSYVPQETSRKEILKQAQTIKDLKNQKAQEEETEGETPEEKVSGFKFFDHLSELTQLEEIYTSLKCSQEIYDSLHKLLIRSTSLRKYAITYQYEKELSKVTKYIDLKNIYETLNGLKKCQKVSIQTPHGSISYELPNKDSTLYVFKNQLNGVLNHPQYTFKPYQFSFDQIKTAKIQLNYQDSLEDLNQVCQSLASSKSLKNVSITGNVGYNQQESLKKNPFKFKDLSFFKQLESLTKLEHLSLNINFDQHILNSISYLIEKSINLKSFIFKRNQNLNQYYLDFSKLFQALTGLQQIQQVYLSTNLEALKITEDHKQVWESHKSKTFHIPLCEFIRNSSKSLQIIDFDEATFNQELVEKVLQSLVESKHHHYMKLNNSLSSTIQSSEIESIIDILKVCDEKGVLVKPYFKFPLSQPTGSSYDYNYDRW